MLSPLSLWEKSLFHHYLLYHLSYQHTYFVYMLNVSRVDISHYVKHKTKTIQFGTTVDSCYNELLGTREIRLF